MPLLNRNRERIGTRLFLCLKGGPGQSRFRTRFRTHWETSKPIMLKNSSFGAGLFRPRFFVAFLLLSAGICLAMFGFNSDIGSDRSTKVPSAERYLPVPGGEPD